MNNRHLLILCFAAFLFLIFPAGFCFSLDIETYDDLFGLEPEKTISMDFMNADLTTVLKIFSQQSGMNFIASTEIAEKKVNLFLDKVPVEEALERILSANNLTYEIKQGSNIFVVKQAKTSDKQIMTRIYSLQYATVPSSKLKQTLSIEGLSGGDSEEGGIVGAIEAILSSDGSIVEDTRTNSLIISDIPDQFPLIESTIARLDVRVPQILIETEMLDISKSTADLLGVKIGNTPLQFSGGSREHAYPWNQNKLLDKGLIDDPSYTFGTISATGLTAALQFLRTQTDTKNLARPRILTLNNEPAEISISTDEAVGVTTSTTSAGDLGTSTEEAERVETGVSLKVTPQANIQTREITMAIEPKVTQARTSNIVINGSAVKDPEERGSKSLLRVRDGDTIILGGLLRSDLDETRTHVPILGRIPVLGSAFSHKDKSATQRELIIFLTPHILADELRRVAPSDQPIVREQSVPAGKNEVIEQELSSFEEQRFSSYR